MKRQKIKYQQLNEYSPSLVPIKTVVPDWYKAIERFFGGKMEFKNGSLNTGLKHCMPFLDSLTVGYSIPLTTDLLIEKHGEGHIVHWNNVDETVLQLRNSEAATTYPKPAGHSEEEFVWRLQTILEVPKGYSLLLTHPLNRYDLPFTTFTGIVDGGWSLTSGNIPFVFKKNFEGVIPAGTPIMQAIPFKQESWESVKSIGLVEEAHLNRQRSMSRLYGWYKSTYWTKKEYL